MGYHLNRLDEPVFIALSKPLLTEFHIDWRVVGAYQKCKVQRLEVGAALWCQVSPWNVIEWMMLLLFPFLWQVASAASEGGCYVLPCQHFLYLCQQLQAYWVRNAKSMNNTNSVRIQRQEKILAGPARLFKSCRFITAVHACLKVPAKNSPALLFLSRGKVADCYCFSFFFFSPVQEEQSRGILGGNFQTRMHNSNKAAGLKETGWWLLLEEGECLHEIVQFCGKKLALDGSALLIEQVFH